MGTGLALAAAQVVQGLLFGLKPRDPLTIGLAVLTVVTAALLAACLPASRATKVDPMVALRYE